MTTDNAENTTLSNIDSLQALRERKKEIRKQINDSEGKISYIWNEIFHKPSPSELASPTKRAVKLLYNSAGIIDGAIFAWKIYQKFSGAKLFLKKKK